MINTLVSANTNLPVKNRESVLPFRDALSIGEDIPIRSAQDIVTARVRGRAMAMASSCSVTQGTLVATVISELARNIILYAGHGEISLASTKSDLVSGLTITALDRGPGIRNIDMALTSGYSSSGGLGLGLPGVRQMADEFEIISNPAEGTRVTVRMRCGFPEQA